MKALKLTANSSSLIVCLFLLLLWVLAIWLVNPLGNFPLNDDWNYARAVKTLLEEGQLQFTCWTLAASLSNILGAAAFCSIFGFSFEVLRCFSLCTAIVGAQALFVHAKNIGKNQLLALIAALTLLFNPLYFSLAFTFMNDVPFLMLSILCSIFLSKELILGKSSSRLNGACCLLLSTLTCLSRQIGIVIPLSYALAAVLKKKDQRSSIGQISLQLIVPVAMLVCFQLYLQSTTAELYSYRMEEAYIRKILAQGLAPVCLQFLSNIFRAGIYLGLFLLPFLFVWTSHFLQQAAKKQKIFFLVLAGEIFATVSLGLFFSKSLMPLADNILYDLGLGPIILAGQTVLKPGIHATFWIFITGFAVLGFSLLCSALISILLQVLKEAKNLSRKPDSELLSFYFFVLALYFGIICFRGFFDRYLIFALPFFMLTLLAFNNERRVLKTSINPLVPALSLVVCLSFLGFSVLGTRDYLEWNRVRWGALGYLQNELKISPSRINGGLEFNGWMAYEKAQGWKKPVFDTEMKSGDDYVISMSELPGYRTLRCYDYLRSLTSDTGYIYVAEKLSANNASKH